jgi:hypothetical protein
LDPTTLSRKIGESDKEGQDLITKMRDTRNQRAQEAAASGCFPCAMESPEFEGAPWRLDLTPAIKYKPCIFLAPGVNKYHLCGECKVSMKEASVWWSKNVEDKTEQ